MKKNSGRPFTIGASPVPGGTRAAAILRGLRSSRWLKGLLAVETGARWAQLRSAVAGAGTEFRRLVLVGVSLAAVFAPALKANLRRALVWARALALAAQPLDKFGLPLCARIWRQVVPHWRAILGLFAPGRPSAIGRRVWAVIVSAFQRHPFRSRPHIGHESLEGCRP
jgi:hypothetical protein